MINSHQLTFLRCLFALVFLWLSLVGKAQINYVPNSGFEEVSDCNLDYGTADSALPWQIINLPIATPDLFHECSDNVEFVPPIGECYPAYPRTGSGMLGLVHLSEEERVYARLLDELPTGVDIYVAYSVLPRKKCEGPFSLICYANTQSLAFSDLNFLGQTVVLETTEILDQYDEWTLMQACYNASGNEKLVLLGNYKLASQTLRDCDYIDENNNYAYYFIDDVIVAPFDVVPDTLYLCANDILELDATFYEVPISWADGFSGAVRTIDQGGTYTVMGRIDDCFLTDKTVIIEIPDGMDNLELDICEEEEITLTAAFPVSWENGDTSSARIITQPGSYSSILLTPCGEIFRTYNVRSTACEIRHFVPNAFSPNNDGINDRLSFFFDADFEFAGELNVFDRWGNQLFNAKGVGPLSSVTWDGSFKNKDLGAGIVVWTYEYVSARDGQTRTIAGDVMVVK